MAAKDPTVYLRHIRDCCRRIAEYISGSGADWAAQPMVMDAVCRNLSVIGEAARKLDGSFRAEHPEIPWSGIIGTRNIVMHAYEHVKPELIKEMAERDVPRLLVHCLRLLNEK